MNLTSGSLTRWPTRLIERPQQHGGGTNKVAAVTAAKTEQQPAVTGEQTAEGEHGAQVGDEAGGEDELADVVAVEARLDHDRVDHGDRRRAERDAADLGRVKVPVEARSTQNANAPRNGSSERHEADGQARLPVLSSDTGSISAPARNVRRTRADRCEEGGDTASARRAP